MDDSTAQDSLKLEVKDFGPIVDAKIDLRPLTVFVGPSNTGKSYLATLIYALHRFFGMSDSVSRRSRDFEIPDDTFDLIVQALPEIASYKPGSAFPASVADLVLPRLYDVDRFTQTLYEEITRCFGLGNTKGLIRHSDNDEAGVTLRSGRLGPKGNNGLFNCRISMSRADFKLNISIPDKKPLRIHVPRRGFRSFSTLASDISLILSESENRKLGTMRVLNILADCVVSSILGPISSPAYYLPADRTGVMHTHRVVASSSVDRASRYALRRDDPFPELTGVVSDFVKYLIEFEPSIYLRDVASDALAKHIEQSVLGGSIHLRPSDMGYSNFSYQPDGWKRDLPIINASSMVSELAPVVLYLRYIVEFGDTLIVEEPESHLHPAKQVEFTRQLAALVQAGVRVIITTHSEWVLEELANIVRRSELSESRRKEMSHGEFALPLDQVGAWLFKPKRRPKGSVVEEIRFDPDAGGLESDFNEVGRQLYNDWATIGNRIAGSTE